MKLDWLRNLLTRSKTKIGRLTVLDDLVELINNDQYKGSIARHPDGERLLITTPQGEEYVLDVKRWFWPKTQEELRVEEETKDNTPLK